MVDDNDIGLLFRHTDPDTSREAAEAVSKVKGRLAQEVMQVARMRGAQGFIDDDLKVAYPDAAESSHRKRRCELVMAGKLVAMPGCARANRRGRMEQVWRIA